MKKLIALVLVLTMMLSLVMTALAADSEVVFGDVNGDGRLSNSDLVIMARYVVGIIDDIDTMLADMNGDGSVSNADLILASRYIVFGADELTFTLTADKTVLHIGTTETVCFYAELSGSEDGVSLYNGITGEPVTVLQDNGKGVDALPLDGVCSCQVVLDTSSETEYVFYAAASGMIKSQYITIKVEDENKPVFVGSMQVVDSAIQAGIFNSDGYSNMTAEERYELARTVIDSIGSIDGESVSYSEENTAFTFKYSNGTYGVIPLSDLGGAEVTEGMPEALPAGEFVKGNGIVLWSYAQSWDSASTRIPYYTALENNWKAAGLDTEVDFDVTVEDYKRLSGYDVIVFSGYGLSEHINGADTQLILLSEDSTAESDKKYESDLISGRICKVNVPGGTKYAVLPEMFGYYGRDGLNGSFVFAESGNLMGGAMTDAIIGAGAEAAVGFHGAADGNYARAVMNKFVSGLIGGKTAEEALNIARQVGDKNGSSDAELFGNGKAAIINAYLENGSFENSSIPTGWKYSGNVRVIPTVGEILPTSGDKMTALTVGASKDSSISQTVSLPKQAKRLSFYYDMFTQKPTAYTKNSKETFEVELITADGTVNVFSRKAASAVWTGVDPYKSNTAYHIGWEWSEIDISKYAGQTVTLRLRMYNSGTSSCDTTMLLDGISISDSKITSCTADEIVTLAKAQVGITEWPAECNNVKYNTAYYGYEVYSADGNSYAWCCTFLWWLFDHENANSLFYGGSKVASCTKLMNYAKSNNQWVTADKGFKPGDMILYDKDKYPKDAEHVGIFIGYDESGNIMCIEGNTTLDPDKDANGTEVMLQIRDLTEVIGAYRPKYASDPIIYDEAGGNR